jgi:hypothetical protein
MIKPMQFAEKWILGHFTQYLPSRRSATELPEPPIQESFDRCWNGSSWSAQAFDGQAFESADLAAQYLDQNRELLESQLSALPQPAH